MIIGLYSEWGSYGARAILSCSVCPQTGLGKSRKAPSSPCRRLCSEKASAIHAEALTRLAPRETLVEDIVLSPKGNALCADSGW